LHAEQAALEPIAARLDAGEPVLGMELSEAQQKAIRSFSLLTLKKRIVLLNTADAAFDAAAVAKIEQRGYRVLAAPAGLEAGLLAISQDQAQVWVWATGAATLGTAEVTVIAFSAARSSWKSFLFYHDSQLRIPSYGGNISGALLLTIPFQCH
jgi:ribosome-binding ATPase YchF (GTP1/OBG family)